MAVNYTDQTYQTDAGASMIVVHSTGSVKDTEITYAPFFLVKVQVQTFSKQIF